MKKLIYLFLGLLIAACSSDDSSDDNQLFLEKYDSVVWERIDDEIDTERVAFVNSSKTLATFYDACFIYDLEGSTETPDGDTLTISIQDETENSISLLVQSALFPEDNSLFISTVTSDGSTYILTRRIDGDIEGDEDITYTRTDYEVCF
jgi:hypothetical protein|tara:strand:+ start:1043 stop:1489 length:447 start_codon:yes stop_codon:yes gene_type:complete